MKKNGGHATHHSPLYSKSKSTLPNEISSVDDVLRSAVKAGFSKDKINLGLALYGRSFELTNPLDSSVGSEVTEIGKAGIVLHFFYIYIHILAKTCSLLNFLYQQMKSTPKKLVCFHMLKYVAS